MKIRFRTPDVNNVFQAGKLKLGILTALIINQPNQSIYFAKNVMSFLSFMMKYDVQSASNESNLACLAYKLSTTVCLLKAKPQKPHLLCYCAYYDYLWVVAGNYMLPKCGMLRASCKAVVNSPIFLLHD